MFNQILDQVTIPNQTRRENFPACPTPVGYKIHRQAVDHSKLGAHIVLGNFMGGATSGIFPMKKEALLYQTHNTRPKENLCTHYPNG
jgi:hypothetical protein